MRQGFTLLELSIVIVIIGLIVAGISAGQSLVRQASLRSVISDVDKFRTAKNSFKLAYDANPVIWITPLLIGIRRVLPVRLCAMGMAITEWR